jgi:aldehyde:ferredoxin oxidoreductase
MGYTGKVLRVNLSDNAFWVEELNWEWAKKFVGGKGLAARTLLGELPPKIDPLSPSNKIILATGPLCATTAPGASKYVLVTKSPATGLFLDSYAGGQFGCELKLAGYDMMIIEGKASKPSYIFVYDDEVEIRDAEGIWGRNCHEAEDLLKKDVGDRDAKVMVIGPAGENLVRFACVNTEYYRHHGRGGAGAVFGSKNLKGIVIRGTQGVEVSRPEEFSRVVEEAIQQVVDSPESQFATSWKGGGGTAEIVDWSYEWGGLPVKNFTSGEFDVGKVNVKAAEPYRISVQACAQCPCACGHYVKINTEGLEGPEYETTALLGPNCYVDSFPEIVNLNLLCDRLGLDTISAGNVVAWAMECFEKGIITEKDTGGINLSFGNAEGAAAILKQIAYRRGLGDVLADGVAVAAKKIGQGSERFAMHVKGLEIPAYEPRAAPSMGLAYATADRGACHLRAWPIGAELWGEYWLGAHPVKLDRSKPDNKAQVVVHQQHYQAYRFSAITCDFLFMDMELLAKLIEAATGFSEVKDWRTVGERIVTVTRIFNIREGMSRKDEVLPERIYSEPLKGGAADGQVLPKSHFEYMLREYYEIRGYDQEGRPTKSRLEALGIADLADYLPA